MPLVQAFAASVSLFLNLIAAASAAYTYARKKMVDFSLSIPLIVSSSLAAPLGSFLNVRIDLKPFLMIMSVVLAIAGVRMLMSPAKEVGNADLSPTKKVTGGIFIGACIGLMGGLLGIGGGRIRRAASHLRAQDTHQDRRRLLDFYRVLFLPDRFSGLRLHGRNQLDVHPASRRGLFRGGPGRGEDHEQPSQGQKHSRYIQCHFVRPVRQIAAPIFYRFMRRIHVGTFQI